MFSYRAAVAFLLFMPGLKAATIISPATYTVLVSRGPDVLVASRH
jgi:hypothetical protein